MTAFPNALASMLGSPQLQMLMALQQLQAHGSSGLGSYVSSPFFQLPLAQESIGEQERLQTKYESDVDQQIADMLRVAGQIGPETLQAYDVSSQGQLGTLQDMFGAGNRRAEELVGSTQSMGQDFLQDFYRRGQDRYNWANQNIEGYGAQQRADIDQAFNQRLADTLRGQQERGFGSTSAMNSARLFNARERGAEQRRLGEDLTRMRQDVLGGMQRETDLTGAQYGAGINTAVLNAMQNRMAQEQTGYGNLANFWGQNAANRAGLVQGGYGTYLNTLGSINRVPPGTNEAPGMVGQNLVDPANPTAGSSSAPWISAGAGAAASLIPLLFLSDKNVKDVIGVVDHDAILAPFENLPIHRWKYIDEEDATSGEHIGPFAQDFKVAFGLGADERVINTIDAIGVLMAAVKALAWRVRELEAA